ncbi:MAG: alcohol dehydrogenase catalytic domain-containing protein [Firmicutes bacterium]|nr:alcohol dehydrogenase catalytic domain-containing protein [Bacillota bacterium]
MLQVVMTEPGVIKFREVETPKPRETELLVRIRRIGICGSDIHVYHGKHPYTSYPVVQGHELSGEVAELGAGVEGFAMGDKVTIQPQVFCGQCYPCRHGIYHICDNLRVMGFQTTGAASEYFAVDASKVFRLPEKMSLDHGAMVEPLAVAVHAIKRAAHIQGQKVVVLGAGPIGNLVAQSALALGAADVLITDLSDHRLEVARRCGIAHRVNTGREDLGEKIIGVFGPDRADLILECVGAEQTMNQAVTLARKGSQIIVVGVFGDKPRVDMGLVQDRELQVIGSLMYQRQDYIDAIDLIDKGKVNLDPLLSKHFAFREYEQAYIYIDNNAEHSLKVMITL